MSWNNCKQCVFCPKQTFTSALFKVLITLKLLHGGRTGAKGSTLEDIAMHMIKYFSLDGDIRSQVLATLKYGVKMHLIQKKKDKFSLILPASSIHLAPCKYKNEERERIQCLFPAVWYTSNGDDGCNGNQSSSCGRRKQTIKPGCTQNSDLEHETKNSCNQCKRTAKSSCPQINQSETSCSQCRSLLNKRPHPASRSGACGPKRTKSNFTNDDYSDMCHRSEHQESENMYSAYSNCSCCSQ